MGPRWTGCRKLLRQAADNPQNREHESFVLFFWENGVQDLQWPTCYVDDDDGDDEVHDDDTGEDD